MPDPTAAARKRLQRARERGQAPPPATCCDCGKSITGTHGAWCSRCWLKTDAGRQWQRERMAAYRAARRVT